MQNFSSLARLEVAEKFVVGWGGTTDTRVIPDNGVTRTNKFGKKK